MVDIASSEQLERLLSALSEQLARAGRHYELVVVGGSALLALGLISRVQRVWSTSGCQTASLSASIREASAVR